MTSQGSAYPFVFVRSCFGTGANSMKIVEANIKHTKKDATTKSARRRRSQLFTDSLCRRGRSIKEDSLAT